MYSLPPICLEKLIVLLECVCLDLLICIFSLQYVCHVLLLCIISRKYVSLKFWYVLSLPNMFVLSSYIYCLSKICLSYVTDIIVSLQYVYLE